MMSYKLTHKLREVDIFFTITILTTYLGIFYSNQFFYLILFLTTIYFYIFKKKIKTNFERFLVIFLPIIFYVEKINEAFQRNDLLFWDNQYLFHFFRCNLYEEGYILQLTKIAYDCKSTLGFGILSEIIAFDNNPWFLSLLIFVLIFLSIIYSLFKVKKENVFLISLFLLSPAFRFLILSLNSDIFIILYISSFFLRKKFKLNILDYLILTIFIQLKIYAIGILIGYLIYTLISKKTLEAIYCSLFLISNSLIVGIFHIGINALSSFELGGVPYVYAPLSSFGLFADYLSYKDVQINESIGNFNFLRIFLIIFIFCSLYIFKSRFIDFTKFMDKKEVSIFITITPLVFLINLFANHGYKFIFNLLLIFLIFNYLSNLQKIFISSSILSTPFFYFLNFDYCCRTYIPSFESTLTFFYSRLTFYLLNLIFFLIFLKLVKFRKELSNN